MQPLKVYIGWDHREQTAYEVCRASLEEHASIPLSITPLKQADLRSSGLYRRTFYVEAQQHYDTQDGMPFSTEFAFSRFLTPTLAQSGLALFCDSDFMWRGDVAELVDLARPEHAVQVVQHDHRPPEHWKMRYGEVQQPYPRKNWSSLMLWNCDHPGSKHLTPFLVNTKPGRWLHGLTWLRDVEIGSLPETWNWLEGHSTLDDPKTVHYTRGTPDIDVCRDVPYADEWLEWEGKINGRHKLQHAKSRNLKLAGG